MLSAGSFGGFACLVQGCEKAEPDLSGVKGRVYEHSACRVLGKPLYLLSFSLHAASQQGLLVLQLPLQIHLQRASRGVTTPGAARPAPSAAQLSLPAGNWPQKAA